MDGEIFAIFVLKAFSRLYITVDNIPKCCQVDKLTGTDYLGFFFPILAFSKKNIQKYFSDFSKFLKKFGKMRKMFFQKQSFQTEDGAVIQVSGKLCVLLHVTI